MALEFLTDSINELSELKKQGYQEVCLGCHTVYKEKPTQNYEDVHGRRDLEMCKCGCDLFDKIDNVIQDLKNQKNSYKE